LLYTTCFGNPQNKEKDKMNKKMNKEEKQMETIDIVNDTAEAFDNNRDYRPEERWHATLDNLARSYRDAATISSELHDRAGYGARKKHIIFGLPGPLIGIVVTCIAALWQDLDNIYMIVPLSSLGAIFTAVHVFFDMGGKAEKFWSYSAQYGGVAAFVDATLARDIDFRTPPDAFFAEVRTRMGNLNGTAPQLPGNGCCGCSKYPGKVDLPKPTQAGSMRYDVARA
jgi:hypothetical protein